MKLDYCCGGGQPFAEAVKAKGLDPLMVWNVIKTFDESAKGQSFSETEEDLRKSSIPDLIEHIVGKHHSYLKEELPKLEAIAEKVDRVHGPRHSELHEMFSIVKELKAHILDHIWKEENVLFPLGMKGKQIKPEEIKVLIAELEHNHGSETALIKKLHDRYSQYDSILKELQEEHIADGTRLKRLRLITNEYTTPDDGCNTYDRLMRLLSHLEHDMHVHISKENNILFPKLYELTSK